MGIVGILTWFMLVSSGCSDAKNGGEDSSSEGKLTIVATTGMIADVARNIVGDRAEVIGLMGAGVDPHTYKAKHNDLQHLMEADIVLYNGLHLEGKMADVLGKLSSRKPVVSLGELLDTSQLRKAAEFEGAFDPHIWFDVRLWKYVVEKLSDTLTKLDSEATDTYRTNSMAYALKLDSLDVWARKEIGTIPEQSRVLITAHDAFGYFGEAYNIEVEGLQGISTVSEAGLADRVRMIDLIVKRKVKAVFVESSIPPKKIEAIVEGVEGKGHSIKIGGTLYSDAMGAEGTPEGTYIGMVRANVRTIVEALR